MSTFAEPLNFATLINYAGNYNILYWLLSPSGWSYRVTMATAAVAAEVPLRASGKVNVLWKKYSFLEIRLEHH